MTDLIAKLTRHHDRLTRIPLIGHLAATLCHETHIRACQRQLRKQLR